MRTLNLAVKITALGRQTILNGKQQTTPVAKYQKNSVYSHINGTCDFLYLAIFCIKITIKIL